MVSAVGARPPGKELARLPSRSGPGDSGQPTTERVACIVEGLSQYKGTEQICKYTASNGSQGSYHQRRNLQIWKGEGYLE